MHNPNKEDRYGHQRLQREIDPPRRSALRRLAKVEKDHAELWADRIQALGGEPPVYRGSTTGEANTFTARVGGNAFALRRLELDESRDIAKYEKQLRELRDEASLAI